MATVTFTPAASWYQPRTIHAGVNIVTGSRAVTTSADGPLLLAKIPHGAKILDGVVYGGGAALSDVRVGTSASTACFVGTASGSAAVRFWNTTNLDAVIPYVVSVSDAAVNRWEYVQMIGTASFGHAAISFWISYMMDDDQ